MANFNISYKFIAVDRFSRASKAISKSMDKVNASASRLGKGLTSLTGMLGGAVTAGALTMGMWSAAKAASAMADSMQDVKRVTTVSDVELDGLKRRFIDLSKVTGVAATDLAKIAFEGGKIGVTKDKMEEYVNMVMKTGGAFDVAQSEAGRAIGQIKTKLSLGMGDTETLLQRVNFLADNTAATGAHMLEIIERTSGSLKTLRMPTEVIAGWSAFANQIEVTPELAASGINMMTKRMMKMPGMMEKMLKDPQNAIQDFLGQIAAIPELERSKVVFKLFGDEAGKFVLKATTNMGLLKDSMDKAMSKEALGSLDREWANILGRASQKALMLRAAATGAAIALGDKLLAVFVKIQPMLMRLVDDFGAWTETIKPEDIEKVANALIKVGNAISTIATNMDRVGKAKDVFEKFTGLGMLTKKSRELVGFGMDKAFGGGDKSEVEITLKGATDQVQSVKSKGSRATQLNVGPNMVPAT